MPATVEKRKGAVRPWGTGHGQLTLVEHSLCPLDTAVSLAENLVHSVKYHFTDKNRHLQTAVARVFCPLGLSPNDELFLWGLLSLTLSQPQAGPEFYDIPSVVNGCSGVMVEAFGDAGRHARSAVGVYRLPRNFAVEVDAVVEID